MTPRVIAVCLSPDHSFSKMPQRSVRLIAGQGVDGDAHAGATVKHRSRVARDASQPNLRQVHLLHEELFTDLAAQGFALSPGQIGENILTRGIDLLSLPTGTRLTIGTAVIEVTGLRNPCIQLDRFAKGLTAALRPRGPDGAPVRLAGVMGVVRTGGTCAPGDVIGVAPGTGAPLAPV